MNAAHAPTAPGFEMRRVDSRIQWDEVHALRYRALRSRNEIAEHPDGLPDDGYDTMLDSITFLLTRRDRAAGCTRSSASAAGRHRPLPGGEVFRREIESAIGWDATIVESSLTLVDPGVQGDPRHVLIHLFKAQMLRCAIDGADWLIAAVPESQIGFHRRVFNMQILSGPERCPRFAAPRVLMGLDYRRDAGVVFKRIPTLEVTPADQHEFLASGRVAFGEERQRFVA